MELNLTGKVAVVTGASKGIGLAITRALAEEGAFVVAASQRGSPELDLLTERWHVRSMRVDLSTDSGPAALVAHAIDQYEHLDIVVNNVGAVRPRPEGYPRRHGRGLVEHLHPQLLRGAAHHARRAAPPAEAQHVVHRHDQLRQRLPPRSPGHRLLRRQGRADQPVQGAVEGVRPPRCPRQHGQSRAGGDRSVAWRRRRRGHAGDGARDAARRTSRQGPPRSP